MQRNDKNNNWKLLGWKDERLDNFRGDIDETNEKKKLGETSKTVWYVLALFRDYKSRVCEYRFRKSDITKSTISNLNVYPRSNVFMFAEKSTTGLNYVSKSLAFIANLVSYAVTSSTNLERRCWDSEWRIHPFPAIVQLRFSLRYPARRSFSAYTRPYSPHRAGEGRTPRRETRERWHTDSLPHIPFCLFNVCFRQTNRVGTRSKETRRRDQLCSTNVGKKNACYFHRKRSNDTRERERERLYITAGLLARTEVRVLS